MKLYYAPFACSLAAHIACREAGLQVTLHRVDLASKGIDGQGDLRELNPMGQVPTLVTDDGHVLSENSAVLMYIADQAAGTPLAPAATSFARYDLLQWLSFVGTELHKKCLAPNFSQNSPEPVKAHGREVVATPLAVAAQHLATRETLLSNGFGVADAYLWWALMLMPHAQVSLAPYSSLLAFYERHRKRPAVVAAVRFEREVYSPSARSA